MTNYRGISEDEEQRSRGGNGEMEERRSGVLHEDRSK